jgi:hypothetical protein
MAAKLANVAAGIYSVLNTAEARLPFPAPSCATPAATLTETNPLAVGVTFTV